MIMGLNKHIGIALQGFGYQVDQFIFFHE